MTAMTVREQGPAIAALALLLTGHPNLRADALEIGRVVTQDDTELGIRVALHQDCNGPLTDFDAWRAALAIEPDAVDRRPAASEGYDVHDAYGTYGGITVHVRCFAPTPHATTD